MIRRLAGGAAAAGIAIFGGVSAMGDDTTRNDQGEIVESGGVGAFAIKFGDCIQLPTGLTEVQSVEGVPCSAPHNAQAYDVFDMPGGDAYPGDLAITDAADEGCLDRFAAFVGVPYEESTLYISYLTPTVGSWAEGDHEIQCLVAPEYGTISFDAQNSGR